MAVSNNLWSLPTLILLALTSAGQMEAQPYRDASLPVDARVRDLIGRMSLEEKFWQLYMIPGGREDPDHDYSRGVFGLQNRTAPDARADAGLHNALQKYFVDSTRLGIPIIPFEFLLRQYFSNKGRRAGAKLSPATSG